jgi:hypothetical protein
MEFLAIKRTGRALTTLFLVTVAGAAIGQHKKKLEHVKGEWIVSNDISLAQARENAINQAKLEALRQAGVPETIQESNLLFHSNDPDQLKQLFESLTSVTISGEIAEFNIVKENKSISESGTIRYDVWIDATVVVHKTARDQGFDMDVKGIQESYSSPEALTFTVKPWKEGYLTVFIIGEKESAQLFPSSAEHQQKLEAQKTYSFPLSRALEYEVSTENSIEINYLCLLYTKEEIPFVKDPTAPNILKFIAGIDPAQKCLKSYSLLIRKKQ